MTCNRCVTDPSHAQIRWIGIIGLALLLEAEGLRRQKREHTLSHATRNVFRTKTRPGKTVFTGAWGLLTWWFVGHIIRRDNT